METALDKFNPCVFSGIDADHLPDETALLNFHHFLHTISKHLDHHELVLRDGSIVDLMIITAPAPPIIRKGGAILKCTRR